MIVLLGFVVITQQLTMLVLVYLLLRVKGAVKPAQEKTEVKPRPTQYFGGLPYAGKPQLRKD